MAPAVKIRDIVAAKGPGSAVKTTPLWKAKLQAPKGRDHAEPVKSPAAAEAAESEEGALRRAERAAEAGGAAEEAAEGAPPSGLRMTFVLAPTLPRPELTRPKPPSDRAAALQQLKDLRQNAVALLEETEASAACSSSCTAGAAPPLGATPSTSFPAAGATPSATAGLAWTPRRPQHPHPHHLQHDPHTPAGPRTALRYDAQGAAACTPGWLGGGAPASPQLSSPCMTELRQQEGEETGGGFLTHFEDPGVLSTPAGAGGGGGRAGGTPLSGAGGLVGGGATPLSALRTMHRLQQLQSLQREGSKLVAALGELSVG